MELMKNKVYRCRISDYTADGTGFAKIEGRAVFVPRALPGERVRIEITRDAGRFCEAALKEVLETSENRTALSCPHEGRCGGCQARHMRYEYSLELKRRKVYDALARIGGVDSPQVFETIGCGDPDRTRNKAEYPIACVDGRMTIGAFAQGSRQVVPLQDCLLQDRQSVQALQWFSQNLQDVPGARHLKFLVTRVNRAGEMMIVLSGEAPMPREMRIFAANLRHGLPNVKSFYYCHLNRRCTHALDGRCVHIDGEEALWDELMGLRFRISPQSFFQVNPAQTEKLYAKALEAAGVGPLGGGRILDAYCGAGTITLAAARWASEALGIEIVQPAIDDAKLNAQVNHLSHKARFICADAAQEIPRLISKGRRFDAAILDPPRRGADEAVLKALAAANIPTIAYVSCNPATLARDVKILVADGYQLKWAQPVDMFPWTAHVETVVMLSHKKPDSVINVKVEFGEGEGKVPLDNIAKRAAAYKPKERVTYKMIKEYIEAKYGFKVHTAYIAEVKRDLGLPMYDAPNAVEELKQPRKHPTPEKVEAIKDALKHFEVI